jgi:hypothetical protein
MPNSNMLKTTMKSTHAREPREKEPVKMCARLSTRAMEQARLAPIWFRHFFTPRARTRLLWLQSLIACVAHDVQSLQ